MRAWLRERRWYSWTSSAHVSAAVRAGPGQTIHEIEVADPGELKGAKAIEAFHRLVAASLRPKKGSRKKKKR